MVAGSVAIGPLAAAALTLGAVAGAPEHVLTGAGLLGLALGWAALAIGSSAVADRPQRWATVPAAALGAVGAALLVLVPGDGALTAAGWVWPPLLLALTAWTTARAVRSMRVRAPFWLLSPVLVLLLLASVGGAAATLRTALAGGPPPMPGQLYDVGDHRLHLSCTGSGGPTVVLLGGMGETPPPGVSCSPRSPRRRGCAPTTGRDRHGATALRDPRTACRWRPTCTPC